MFKNIIILALLGGGAYYFFSDQRPVAPTPTQGTSVYRDPLGSSSDHAATYLYQQGVLRIIATPEAMDTEFRRRYRAE